MAQPRTGLSRCLGVAPFRGVAGGVPLQSPRKADDAGAAGVCGEAAPVPAQGGTPTPLAYLISVIFVGLTKPSVNAFPPLITHAYFLPAFVRAM